MWLPTNRSALRSITLLLLITLSALCMTGCGYSLASREPGIFGNSSSTLKIKAVDNPTMYSWLPYEIRSLMRDEIAQRKLATWVDDGQSDFVMRIKIKRFTVRSGVRDSNDSSLTYSTTLTLEAVVNNSESNAVVWRSGEESITRTFDSANEKVAGREAAELLIQKIADRMRSNF